MIQNLLPFIQIVERLPRSFRHILVWDMYFVGNKIDEFGFSIHSLAYNLADTRNTAGKFRSYLQSSRIGFGCNLGDLFSSCPKEFLDFINQHQVRIRNLRSIHFLVDIPFWAPFLISCPAFYCQLNNQYLILYCRQEKGLKHTWKAVAIFCCQLNDQYLIHAPFREKGIKHTWSNFYCQLNNNSFRIQGKEIQTYLNCRRNFATFQLIVVVQRKC